MHLRRLIRDEKEEVERREGMEEREDGDEDQRGRSSGIGTPHHETGGTTPLHGTSQEQEVGTPGGLSVERDPSGRGKSPMRSSQNPDGSEGAKADVPATEDEEMAEDGELAAEPEHVAEDGKEEGEEDDGQTETQRREQMDTS